MSKTNSGKELEEDIKELAAQYERKRILTLRKVDPPTRIIGKGKIVFLKNPFPDFVGVITARMGKALFIEAKETHDGELRVGSKHKTGIDADQLHSLRVWYHSGAYCGVVWRCYESEFIVWPRTFFLPVPFILHCCETKQRQHIKWQDVPAHLRGKDWIKTMLDQGIGILARH